METLPYLAKISLYWIILYGGYWLLLRRQTFFVLNRAYLLGALLFSFGLPLLQYSGSVPGLAGSPVPETMYQLTAFPLKKAKMVVAQATAPAYVVVAKAKATDAPFPWLMLLWALYAAGSAFMLVRLLRQLRRLFSYLQKGERVEMDGYTLVLSDEKDSFSFLNWVVVNRRDYENDFDTVLRHELVHVRQRHSVDILLVEILQVVFWFNPVLILYKKSLQQVHEYLADDAAPQRDRYANFLLAYALHHPANTLTNNFLNSSHLKNRIKMLYKNRNSKWALGKYLSIVPLIGIVLMLTAARERITDAVEDNAPLLAPGAARVAELPEVSLGETTTVKGTVRSSKTKNLLPGANVILAGTSRGATTDANGAFELDEVPLDSKLAISYVGYETREVEITRKNEVVNVVLEWQQNSLDNVVIVGYGFVKSNQTDADSTKIGAGSEKEGYTVVEQTPEFPGGIQEIYKFLARNIKYPTEAMRDDVEGKVIVTFTVSDKGRIRNPQVIQSLGGGTDEEALRVVLNMPSWKPAKQNGRPVAMEYVLPIEFMLEKPETKEDKEKRQGKATNFNDHSMPDFKFENAVDFGIPSGGPNSFNMKEVPMPASIYSKLRFPAHLNSEQTIIKIEKDSIKNDSIKPARFYNYRNPFFNTKN